MDGTVPKLRWAVKQKLAERMRRCRVAKLRTRYLIIVHLVQGSALAQTARAVAPSTVYRAARRFRQAGEVGLLDGREDNGQTKLDEEYVARLYDAVRSSPQAHGWRHRTWTREMLAETLRQQTRAAVHVATMSRAWKRISARRGRPRPRARCPWSTRAKSGPIPAIRQLLGNPSRGQVDVCVDEVDIHLNPEIGCDWMVGASRDRCPGRGRTRSGMWLGAWRRPAAGWCGWRGSDRTVCYSSGC
jgi:hypothetical protein